MLFKEQIFIESPGGPGWSETYWIDETDLATALLQLAGAVTARMDLLRSEFKCVFAKAHATTGAVRQVGVLDLSVPQPGTYVPTIAAPVDHDDQECILYRLSDPVGHYNLRFLHGIGTWVSSGDQLNMEANFVTALQSWFTFLKASYLIAKNFVHGVPTNTYSITHAAVERITNHKVGRPFGSARGRRSIVV